ncbi:hypothetical protein DPMN_098153 [Dreissena polymorpha]|uniref:Uncharacterized protein n=1 Tax=Dreissena polymorpha TaxID=45954 RepID=A0A9D4R5D4_DREPO|nr:hypothetical protein DPMN_098153 [Dreissena polymorpha]
MLFCVCPENFCVQKYIGGGYEFNEFAGLFCIAGKTSAGTPSDGGGGGGWGGKAVGDDDCDYDKDCNADTDNSDDDNGDHEWIIIRPQTKFRAVYRSELVCLSVGPSVGPH